MLNLNVATQDELDAIPMLQGLAFEIVRYHEERGGFSDLRQLDEVPGLSGKTSGVEELLMNNN